MRKKAHKSVTKLIVTSIKIDQAYMYFNSYFLTSVYFGVGIIELTKVQEDELKSLYKAPILKKLGLSIKFPKELLYVR